jgi:hypothetical protein
MPLFLHLFIFIPSFIRKHSLRPIHIFTAVGSLVESPWGAEPRFELGPALQQASALPTEPHCTASFYRNVNMVKFQEKTEYMYGKL